MVIAAFLPLAASAQTWRSETFDTGGLVYGSVFAPEASLSFTCNTPSPQGRPLMETEDHETIRNGPFGVFVSLGSNLVPPQGGGTVLPAVTLVLNGTGYRLPPVVWDELYGEWMVELSMTDPLWTALSGASDLVLDAGTGAAWRYPTDGLAEGIEVAIGACVAGWMQAGYGVPAGIATAAAGAAPLQQPASLITPEIDRFLRRGCNASYTLDERAIEAHDLDRDGVPDRVVDWAGVTCNAAMSRPYCGAAYCSIEVFLSTRPGDPQSMLGVGFEVTQAANGAPGLRFGGTAGGCARGECDRVFWWDGTQFRY